MILFLIEIYLLGCSISVHFRDDISDLFLSLTAIFFGLIGYVLNFIILVLVGIKPNIMIISIIMGVEILLIILFKLTQSPKYFHGFNPKILIYFFSGMLFILASLFFLNYKVVFASPDSLYLIIMSKSIFETGFSQWYFTSPLLWGIFVPILQTIGFLFNLEYTWFIQPVLSFSFLGIFFFSIYEANLQIFKKKWLPILLAILSCGFLLSSNLYRVSQYYIHTNLNSGISLFIVIVSLYFYTRNKNPHWLWISAIFLIMFGFVRIENVIIASLIIVLTISSKLIEYKKMLNTFVPYLLLQILWNILVIFLNPDTYANLMSTNQLMLVTVGLIILLIFLYYSKLIWVQSVLLPVLNKIIIYGIITTVIVITILNPTLIYNNFWANIFSMFSTGKWFATFWVVIMLLALVRPKSQIAFRSFLDILIIGFFAMIPIVGFFKGKYHIYWWDSANRMYIHILPIMLFYFSLLFSSKFKLSKQEEQQLMIDN